MGGYGSGSYGSSSQRYKALDAVVLPVAVSSVPVVSFLGGRVYEAVRKVNQHGVPVTVVRELFVRGSYEAVTL